MDALGQAPGPLESELGLAVAVSTGGAENQDTWLWHGASLLLTQPEWLPIIRLISQQRTPRQCGRWQWPKPKNMGGAGGVVFLPFTGWPLNNLPIVRILLVVLLPQDILGAANPFSSSRIY